MDEPRAAILVVVALIGALAFLRIVSNALGAEDLRLDHLRRHPPPRVPGEPVDRSATSEAGIEDVATSTPASPKRASTGVDG